MGLVHEFYIEKEEIKVVIEDNLIQYFIDYFEWIETRNPWNIELENNKGLNYYGETEIPLKSIELLKNTLDALLQLFRNAPKVIILTGDYYEDEEGNFGYEKIKYLREDILAQIEELYKLCIIAETRKLSIFHSGI